LWGAPLIGISALLAALYIYWHPPRERTYQLRMTGGHLRGTRHELAQVLRRHAVSQGLTLAIEPTAGSEEALDLVNSRKLDVALVQGGLRVEDRPHVRQVATLHIEPLHLLVKKELAESVSRSLRALEGKTVNVGEVGSGTHSLAEAVMAFAGLAPTGQGGASEYAAAAWSSKKLVAEKDRTRLPDAVFEVSSLPSEAARELVHKHDFRLAPLPYGEAFSLHALAVGGVQPTQVHVEKSRVAATSIPAFTYQVEPPVPAAPVPTLGTRLLVVAHQDVDLHAIRQLVEAVYLTEFASATRPPLDTKLLDLPPEFPWHAGTRDYLQRNTPIVSGVMMDATQKGFAIFAAAASGLFVLWQWRQMRSQFSGGLRGYIGLVAALEARVRQIERDQMGGVQQLLELRDELDRLKSDALDRLAKGELADRELLSAFLLHATDVRGQMNRLIEPNSETPQRQESAAAPPH
jgi:TRAP-type uncharacterized transport system substrate-binding protein